jgi:hypothetical protein
VLQGSGKVLAEVTQMASVYVNLIQDHHDGLIQVHLEQGVRRIGD